MTDIRIGPAVTTLLTLYALVIGAFLISENRASQATLAWMLAFLLVPGLGVLIYFLFGRNGKAFSKQRKLLKQDLAATALPVLSPILSARTRKSPDSSATTSRAQDPAHQAYDEPHNEGRTRRGDHDSDTTHGYPATGR